MSKWKISLIILLVAGKSFGQVEIPKLDVKVKKHGPTFGVQRGLYTTFELGLEKQWKNIQLKTELAKNNLYMSIVNLFIEAEDKKQPNAIPYRGGKRRGYHYNKTKKNKVTNRTKLNKTKRHFSRG